MKFGVRFCRLGYNAGRSPHGERGLKYVTLDGEVIAVKSLPARGAWIEIPRALSPADISVVAPRTGSVD